jgi:phosphate transport system protein
MNHPPVEPMDDILKMAFLVRLMLLKCLEAFVTSDADIAHSLLIADDEVDSLRDAVHAELLDVMQRGPSILDAAIDRLFIARNLERIGDHVTNIAEDVLFLVKGIDVRHRSAHVVNAQKPKRPSLTGIMRAAAES